MHAKETLLLEIKDLRVHFPTGRGAGAQVIKAVDGVDLAVYCGRSLCLIGESGCGKSALSRAIAGAARQPEQVISGRLAFYLQKSLIKQIDLNQAYKNPWEAPESGIPIAMIGQEPVPSLSILHTIGSQMIQAIRRNHKISKQEARGRAVDILERLEVPKPDRLVYEYPFRLSADIHMRVQIAVALSCEPSLLIIDDPAVMLDMPGQALILDMLSTVQQETGMTILYTARHPDMAAQLADDIAVMHQGKIVEMAGVQAIFSEPKHPYTQALLGGSHKRSGAGSSGSATGNFCCSPGICAYYPYCPQAVSECGQFEPRMVTIGDRHDVRCLIYETLLTEPLEQCERCEPESDIWQLERLLMQ